MISHAQNLEDVVLFRLTPMIASGTFVDVGAGHPVLDNVTYALYLAGWRGVNLEPMAREVEMLRDLRPDDMTIRAAVGREAGTVTLYEAPIDNRGATTSDQATVSRYEQDGQSFTPFEAEVVTLASVLDRFAPGAVHVVKVDVEGMEEDVIAGADLARTRPWVLVVESTVPNTQIDSSTRWEPIVLAAGYVMTLFDGLNRFYVRDDLPEIQHLLNVPANVFDGWERRVETDLRQATVVAENFAAELQSAAAEAAPHIAALRAELEVANKKVLVAETYARSLEVDREQVAALVAALSQRIEELEPSTRDPS